MSTAEHLLSVLRSHCEAIVKQTEEIAPDSESLVLIELGDHMKAIAQIYNGEYRDEYVNTKVKRLYPKKRGWLLKTRDSIKEKILGILK